MVRQLAILTIVSLASVFVVDSAYAQRANVPGIIQGAIEGDVPGAAGAAMGYGYRNPSGYYYPGDRDVRGGQYWRDGRGRYWGYDPYYDGYYGSRGYWGPGYRYSYSRPRYGYRTGEESMYSNPPVDAQPYRAVIVNPAENQDALTFSINGQPYELKAGQQQEFTGRTPRVITFDRGNGRDVARYSLADGTYTFTPTQNGWELYRRPLTAAPATGDGTNPPAPTPQQ